MKGVSMKDSEKLQEIINQIDWLLGVNITINDPEFQEWHSRAERFLHNKYGCDSIEFKVFSDYTFIPNLAKPPRDKKLLEFLIYDKCHSDLRTIQNLFQDYLRDMQDEEQKAVLMNQTDSIERVFKHFKNVAVQLTRRHSERDTLLIQDEYDVQDLLRALLALYYDDVRPEEWTPSYAGSSVRIDFLIPEIEAVIEVKKTRPSMSDKTLSEELIIDIEKYQTHPTCKKIYCFVYDPDMILRNPAAIKNDLEKMHDGFVRIYIES